MRIQADDMECGEESFRYGEVGVRATLARGGVHAAERGLELAAMPCDQAEVEDAKVPPKNVQAGSRFRDIFGVEGSAMRGFVPARCVAVRNFSSCIHLRATMWIIQYLETLGINRGRT
jgi:hypothetical protein